MDLDLVSFMRFLHLQRYFAVQAAKQQKLDERTCHSS